MLYGMVLEVAGSLGCIDENILANCMKKSIFTYPSTPPTHTLSCYSSLDVSYLDNLVLKLMPVDIGAGS